MPVIDVCWVGALPADADSLALRLADVLGDALAAAPGGVCVRLQHLPAEHHAENGDPPHGVPPVFVRVLHTHPPTGAPLHAEVTTLTTAVAHATGRPPERVHLEYAPAGAGRVACGGRLLE